MRKNETYCTALGKRTFFECQNNSPPWRDGLSQKICNTSRKKRPKNASRGRRGGFSDSYTLFSAMRPERWCTKRKLAIGVVARMKNQHQFCPTRWKYQREAAFCNTSRRIAPKRRTRPSPHNPKTHPNQESVPIHSANQVILAIARQRLRQAVDLEPFGCDGGFCDTSREIFVVWDLP